MEKNTNTELNKKTFSFLFEENFKYFHLEALLEKDKWFEKKEFKVVNTSYEHIVTANLLQYSVLCSLFSKISTRYATTAPFYLDTPYLYKKNLFLLNLLNKEEKQELLNSDIIVSSKRIQNFTKYSAKDIVKQEEKLINVLLNFNINDSINYDVVNYLELINVLEIKEEKLNIKNILKNIFYNNDAKSLIYLYDKNIINNNTKISEKTENPMLVIDFIKLLISTNYDLTEEIKAVCEKIVLDNTLLFKNIEEQKINSYKI